MLCHLACHALQHECSRLHLGPFSLCLDKPCGPRENLFHALWQAQLQVRAVVSSGSSYVVMEATAYTLNGCAHASLLLLLQVHALMYISPEHSSGTHKALGQVHLHHLVPVNSIPGQFAMMTCAASMMQARSAMPVTSSEVVTSQIGICCPLWHLVWNHLPSGSCADYARHGVPMSLSLPAIQCIESMQLSAPLYLPQPSTALHVQVWWYVAGLLKGKVSVHDVATSRTVEVPMAMPVSCLQLDSSHQIWIGYRGGTVRVYNEATCRPICSALRCCTSDIT